MTDLFGLDVQSLLYAIGVGNAVTLMVMGTLLSIMHLLGVKPKFFWNRMFPAVRALVITSLAAGVVLWVANKLFA